jgi:hypothetical protein
MASYHIESPEPEERERKHYLITCDEEDCHYVALTRPDLAEHKRMMH